jgi:hypothetical protein
MPGLLRAMGRTAVIAGTASAVNGRVQRRQARRWAADDPPEAAPDENPQEAEPQARASTSDMLEQLKQLGELKAQGVLTEDEFDAQKAKILAS